MAQQLAGRRVAIVVTDGFEQDELEKPREALEESGAITEIVSPRSGKVKGWKYTDWGTELKIDKEVEQADPNQYDALMLPGGQMIPDSLRMNQKVVDFTGSFVRSGKPIVAICHSPWTLIEAKGLLRKPCLTLFLRGKGIMIDHRNSKGGNQDQSSVDPRLDHRPTELIPSREVDMNALGRSVLHFLERKIGADGSQDPSRRRDSANEDERDYVLYVNVQLSFPQ